MVRWIRRKIHTKKGTIHLTKVLLTEAQNKALATFVFHYGGRRAKGQAMAPGSFGEPYASLNKLSYDTISKAVDFGWDVQEAPELVEYAVGDIVVGLLSGNVYEVERDMGGRTYAVVTLVPDSDITYIGERGRITFDNVRMATLDEAFFAKLGRKPLDFREGDIYIDEEGTAWAIGQDAEIHNCAIWYKSNDFTALYPASARVSAEVTK